MLPSQYTHLTAPISPFPIKEPNVLCQGLPPMLPFRSKNRTVLFSYAPFTRRLPLPVYAFQKVLLHVLGYGSDNLSPDA